MEGATDEILLLLGRISLFVGGVRQQFRPDGRNSDEEHSLGYELLQYCTHMWWDDPQLYWGKMLRPVGQECVIAHSRVQ